MCSDSAISCLHLIGVLRALCMIQKLLFCHREYKVSISPLCSAFYFLPLFWCWSSWSNSLVEPIGWPQGQVFSVCETRKLCGDRNWTACPLFLRIQWYHWRGVFFQITCSEIETSKENFLHKYFLRFFVVCKISLTCIILIQSERKGEAIYLLRRNRFALFYYDFKFSTSYR